MPVLECSCGMIMSVSAAEPRKNCIRCGSTNLHGFARRVPNRPAPRENDTFLGETPILGTPAAIRQGDITFLDAAVLSVAWPSAATV